MKRRKYPVDASAILYLAQMRQHHTNVYRFTVTMEDTVCPETLQKAADSIYSRFPTIFAGFQPGLFSYSMVPAERAPQVVEDPGLLYTMSAEEIQSCAYRIFYSDNRIIMEAFHALTDGYGAICSLRTLVAEYLHLRFGISSLERKSILETEKPDWNQELRDAYLDYGKEKPVRLPNRSAYQLPGRNRDWNPKGSIRHFSTDALLQAARCHGVSLTAMLSCLMAEAIMELQKQHGGNGKAKPVRIMVPIDLRRLFPSQTLRNFILYALPTMEWGEAEKKREYHLASFHRQLKQQVTKEALGAQVSANVQTQQRLLFRLIPLRLKLAAMRLAYRYFGECNSSITLTNLGPVALSDALKPFVRSVDVLLTPRCQSPYNCGIISCGDTTSISITRYGAQPELEPLFYEKLNSILA